MARKTTSLSATEVKNAKLKEKDYVLSDGNGLQLRIRSNGSRLWNLNYIHPHTKKRVNIGLGTYPAVSLADARTQTIEYRSLLAKGVDPKSYRNSSIANNKQLTENKLIMIARRWFDLKKDEVTKDYAEDIWRSLENHIFPTLADTPINQITAPEVISILKPLEAKGSLETVKRVTQRLNEIMVYAVNSGLIPANPLTNIRATFKKPKKESMKSVPPTELPKLMLAIHTASIRKTTRYLIEWQLHTMTRPIEAATTRWEEIDLKNKIWRIPASKMKKRRDHSIPLTDQCLALIEAMRPISGHREYVFPADRNPRSHTNSQTANMALKRMGYENKLVSHGLRSIASTALNEHGFDPDLIESALAHEDKNQIRAAYNRAEYIERRREMMCWWSDYIEKASNVNVSIK
ncbi:integrase domain-containing protein [Gayadomonas joobiniege]|uniref:integrase domain-containing protein n=1 Tax=Gayadomonas joobiniege TaxID=1234606 RepID=UPI00037F93AA|nr:integrase domain-containing protein [Gayadomonas joobiniege]